MNPKRQRRRRPGPPSGSSRGGSASEEDDECCLKSGPLELEFLVNTSRNYMFFVVFDAGFEKMLVHVYTNSVRKSESLKWAVYGGYEVIQIPFSTN